MYLHIYHAGKHRQRIGTSRWNALFKKSSLLFLLLTQILFPTTFPLLGRHHSKPAAVCTVLRRDYQAKLDLHDSHAFTSESAVGDGANDEQWFMYALLCHLQAESQSLLLWCCKGNGTFFLGGGFFPPQQINPSIIESKFWLKRSTFIIQHHPIYRWLKKNQNKLSEKIALVLKFSLLDNLVQLD